MRHSHVSRARHFEISSSICLRPAAETFRRFLQYIKLCFDKQRENGSQRILIDKYLVEKAITREQLSEEMDAELSRLFPKNVESRYAAAEILNLLEEKKNMNQKAIANQLKIPEYGISRIINKLESGGYIQREKEGHDKIVRLTQPA